MWIVYIDQLTMRGDPLVTRVCSQHRYTRHKAAVLLLFHKGYKVAPNILRNIKFVPKRCWVKWPISHACAHTLWPFWYPCHTGRKAILLLLLEQPEGYVEVDNNNSYYIPCEYLDDLFSRPVWDQVVKNILEGCFSSPNTTLQHYLGRSASQLDDDV